MHSQDCVVGAVDATDRNTAVPTESSTRGEDGAYDGRTRPAPDGQTRRESVRGIRLALDDGARLTVLHVLEDLPLPVGEHADRLRETLTTEAEAFVERVADRAEHAGVEGVEGVVRHRERTRRPSPRLRDSTVTPSSSGDTVAPNANRTCSGGVTSRVLRHSAVPVFVVPTDAPRPLTVSEERSDSRDGYTPSVARSMSRVPGPRPTASTATSSSIV